MRGSRPCSLHPLLLAGGAESEASVHTGCIHCCAQELPIARHPGMPLASIGAGRRCRLRGTSTCLVHPLLCAGAALGRASVLTSCIHCCSQELPMARHHRMPFASMGIRRSYRWRGIVACRLHRLRFAVVAACEASVHAACTHGCSQVLPRARHHRIPLASIVACRRCRLRGIGACRLHRLLAAGVAACEASVHAACTHCRSQALPRVRHQCIRVASIVVRRSCRQRGIRACRLHLLSLAGVAACEAPAHAACNHCRSQELPVAGHPRMLLASIVVRRSCWRASS